jgi:hypothetical protein
MFKISQGLIYLMVMLSLYGCAEVGAGAATYAIGDAYLSKEGAEGVKIVQEASECKFITSVEAKTYWGGMMKEKALGKVISDLTHKAADKGANTIVITKQSCTFNGSSAQGNAYLCPE